VKPVKFNNFDIYFEKYEKIRNCWTFSGSFSDNKSSVYAELFFEEKIFTGMKLVDKYGFYGDLEFIDFNRILYKIPIHDDFLEKINDVYYLILRLDEIFNKNSETIEVKEVLLEKIHNETFVNFTLKNVFFKFYFELSRGEFCLNYDKIDDEIVIDEYISKDVKTNILKSIFNNPTCRLKLINETKNQKLNDLLSDK